MGPRDSDGRQQSARQCGDRHGMQGQRRTTQIWRCIRVHVLYGGNSISNDTQRRIKGRTHTSERHSDGAQPQWAQGSDTAIRHNDTSRTH